MFLKVCSFFVYTIFSPYFSFILFSLAVMTDLAMFSATPLAPPIGSSRTSYLLVKRNGRYLGPLK